MFPFQRSCELSFKIDDEEDQFEQKHMENLILLDNNASVGVANNVSPTGTSSSYRGRGRGGGRGRVRVRGRNNNNPLSLASSSNNNNNDEEEQKKRTFHREVERQRRQEMSNLFESLRSVLPDEFIKGKRAICDHLAEAVNYIKDLEKNVKELGEKRDELKQSVTSTSSSHELGSGSGGSSTSRAVAIRQFAGGLEIEISVLYQDQDEFLLSNAIQVAFEEGLDVVSCTSTKFHEKFIHSIQCEVSDVTYIDQVRLEQRLNELLCGPNHNQ